MQADARTPVATETHGKRKLQRVGSALPKKRQRGDAGRCTGLCGAPVSQTAPAETRIRGEPAPAAALRRTFLPWFEETGTESRTGHWRRFRIGRAVAILFAREGAGIALAYVNEHEDARLTKDKVEAEGRRCLLIPGDVKSQKYCERAVARTVKEFGRLDVLVNNAAFQVHTSKFEDLTAKHFDETLKTNLYGYFYMAQAAVKHMKSGSAIVNTGSVAGLLGNKSLLDYSMTKGGIHAFTRSLATNLVARGIRVNAVALGPVWTMPMVRRRRWRRPREAERLVI